MKSALPTCCSSTYQALQAPLVYPLHGVCCQPQCQLQSTCNQKDCIPPDEGHAEAQAGRAPPAAESTFVAVHRASAAAPSLAQDIALPSKHLHQVLPHITLQATLLGNELLCRLGLLQAGRHWPEYCNTAGTVVFIRVRYPVLWSGRPQLLKVRSTLEYCRHADRCRKGLPLKLADLVCLLYGCGAESSPRGAHLAHHKAAAEVPGESFHSECVLRSAQPDHSTCWQHPACDVKAVNHLVT